MSPKSTENLRNAGLARGLLLAALLLPVPAVVTGCRTVPVGVTVPDTVETSSANPSLSRKVVPGQSLGEIKIGQDYSDIINLLPKKEGTDRVTESKTIQISKKNYECPKSYHWVSADHDPRGESYFYFDADDRVYNMATRSSNYRLTNGLGVGSGLNEIRNSFPDVREYKLEFVTEKVVGENQERYMVDRKLGIAFQSDFTQSEGLISMIYVFKPDGDFLPWGCVTPPARYVPID